MALQGMTGFARTDGEKDAVRWAWEARSVNGRGLDVKIRLPPGFEVFEAAIREAAGKRFRRGSVQIALSLKQESTLAQPRINHAYVESLIAAGRPYIEAGKAEPPAWDRLLVVRGALMTEEAAEPDAFAKAASSDLAQTMNAALDGLAAARIQEGRTLAEIFTGLLARIESLVNDAKACAAAAPAAIQERIKTRLATLAPEVQLDPQRLAQEAALAAMRADVTEEIERLSAHAAEARALIASGEPAGRRLDFLAQEFSREANTLCSKSQDLALTRLGLDLKTAVDQLKEQAANVE